MIRTSFLFAMLFGFAFIPAERSLARKPLFLAGSAACLGGVVVMFLAKLTSSGPGSLTGLAIIVATAVFWGAYAVSVRRNMRGYSPRLSFGVISLYTAGPLVVLMLAKGNYAALAGCGARAWAMLVISALVGIAFGHVIYYRGIYGLGPVVASGVLMAAPFVTLTGSYLILKESLLPTQLLGGLAVVGGGVLLVRAKARVESAK